VKNESSQAWELPACVFVEVHPGEAQLMILEGSILVTLGFEMRVVMKHGER
jgi:hypothetical protein